MRKTVVLHRGRSWIRLRDSAQIVRRLMAMSPVLPGEYTTMERVTLRIPKQQIEEVEQMVETGQFPNRSEAIRSAVREMLSEQSEAETRQRPTERSWAKV